jgi:hypothetical protein
VTARLRSGAEVAVSAVRSNDSAARDKPKLCADRVSCTKLLDEPFESFFGGVNAMSVFFVEFADFHGETTNGRGDLVAAAGHLREEEISAWARGARRLPGRGEARFHVGEQFLPPGSFSDMDALGVRGAAIGIGGLGDRLTR